MVKNSPASAGNVKRHGFDPWVGKIPLEEGMATRSSILAWRIPWTESTPSPAFIICRLFNDGLSDRCEMIPHCGHYFLIMKKLSLSIFGCFYLLFHCCVGFSLVAASRGYSLLQ